eukprot:scaffold17298_cov63-Attheya_sp.AAC.1
MIEYARRNPIAIARAVDEDVLQQLLQRTTDSTHSADWVTRDTKDPFFIEAKKYSCVGIWIDTTDTTKLHVGIRTVD